MSELNERWNEDSIEDGVGIGHHLMALLTVFASVGFWFWAYWGTLDIVSLTQGEVIPSTQVKQVQHLEGGIVRHILVKEGDKVIKGQPLVELESVSSGADVEEIQARFITLRLELARLEAEARGMNAPKFDADLIEGFPKKVERTIRYFNSRKKGHFEDIAGLKEQIVQQQQQVREINTRIRNNKKRLKLVQEQVGISDELLSRDITNRFTHLDLLKESNIISSSIEEDGMALLRAGAALKESRSTLARASFEFQEQAQGKLSEIRGQVSELDARLRKYSDSLLRRIISSPVDGVVKTLLVFTEGGVLQPGGTVLEIVPGGDKLVIESKLPIQDIGYVKEGQKAKVSLTSSDASRFGKLEGIVSQISPDTLVTEDGIPYYKVRIVTGEAKFKKGDLEYRLFPGMVVQAAIHTGSRTVLEYLFSPFVSYIDPALTER
ncbi:MAG: HlyD family type I secretion periplasmic adaptor subunit [Magnetococcales bacterium]|nr:HlyD family type I secretion periplasmic adaptor subunit [Magnetococcales bacterium]